MRFILAGVERLRKLWLVVALILCFFVSGCSPESRDTIFAYVNDTHELLEVFPYEELEELGRWDSAYSEFIKNHLGNETIVESIYAYNEDIIQFSCRGWGLSVGSIYTGFYFSRNDTPFAFEFGDGSDLEEIQTGVFYWQSEERSTRNIRTGKIRDNWYYFIQEWR